MAKDLKGEYGRCLFNRVQSQLPRIGETGFKWFWLICHALSYFWRLDFSVSVVLYHPALSCTTSCTFLHHPVPSCTILYHTVPHCAWFDPVYVFEHRALWSHCRFWICAGPRSRFLQGAFPQSDITIYLKTGETFRIFRIFRSFVDSRRLPLSKLAGSVEDAVVMVVKIPWLL